MEVAVGAVAVASVTCDMCPVVELNPDLGSQIGINRHRDNLNLQSSDQPHNCHSIQLFGIPTRE